MPNAVFVAIDRKRVVAVSQLEIGVTHTQYGLDTGGDATAIARGKKLLVDAGCRLHNVHIMGWGTLNPNPAPGVYDWSSLDRRIAMVRSIPGAVPVLTLCGCPDWMKGGMPGETNWSKLEVAPLPEHYADFAALAATIARRYPDVRHFQVWNEMKGLWNAKENNWDYRGYTTLYNLVYDALKVVNRTNQIGGPYLVVEGTGSSKEQGNFATAPPLSARNRQVIEHWLRNKRGADFITLDRGLVDFHDKNVYSVEEQMALTHHFGGAEKQIRQLPGGNNLPLWWAEFYASSKAMTPEMKAAVNASAFRSALLGGAATILLWQPMDTDEVGHALFSDVRKPDGGRFLPLHNVVKMFNTFFKPGTLIVEAKVSSPDIEALTSKTMVMLINKRSEPVNLLLRTRTIVLPAYGVSSVRYV